jgi:hypothetical protein
MLVVTVIIDPSGHEHLTATAEEFYAKWRELLQTFGDDAEVEIYSKILPGSDHGCAAPHSAFGLSAQLPSVTVRHQRPARRREPMGGTR